MKGNNKSKAGRPAHSSAYLRKRGAPEWRIKQREEEERLAANPLSVEKADELDPDLADILICAGFEVPKSLATAKALIGEVLSHLSAVRELHKTASEVSVVAALAMLTESQVTALRGSCEASQALNVGTLGLKPATAASMSWFDALRETGLYTRCGASL